jgi:hypothetical protein
MASDLDFCHVCTPEDQCGDGRGHTLNAYKRAQALAKSQEETIKKLMDEQDALWGALANGVLLPHMKKTRLVEAVLELRSLMSKLSDENRVFRKKLTI